MGPLRKETRVLSPRNDNRRLNRFLRCNVHKGIHVSDYNSTHNRAVWFDIPVADLDRAVRFYQAVLGVGVKKENFGGSSIGVIEHKDGNGGCLVPEQAEIAAGGILVYMNVDGRIRDAVQKVVPHGGTVIEPVQSIGPHGFRAVVLDSEGNRIALHSNTDA
jgi:predicted enzyme related to lactoylglutathione lyase